MDVLLPIKYIFQLFNINGFLTENRFFFDFGTRRSSLLIFYSSLIFIFIFIFNKNNIKNHFKVFLYKNYTTLIIFFSIGFFINYSYVYFIKNIENLFIFYSPTIDRRLSNIYVLSLFYGLTSVLVFVFFYKLFYKNKFILYFSTLIAVSSPISLWVLFSSSIRDFSKYPVFLLFCILSLYLYRRIISYTDALLISLILLILVPFRLEIITYYPIIFLFLFFNNNNFYKNFILIILIFSVILIGYFLLTFNNDYLSESSLIFKLGFFSEDITRLYINNLNIYYGPMDDHIRLILFDKYLNLRDFLFNKAIFIEMLIGYFYLIKVIIFNVLLLPLNSNFYPDFLNNSYLFNFFSNLRFFLSYKIIYFSSISLIFLFNIKRLKQIFICLIIIVYLVIINGIAFHHKNIFHLEIIVYLFLFYSLFILINFFKTKLKK
jgi:hypothetical protein